MASGEVGDDVVRAACAGDDEAFRLLYRAVAPGLVRYLRALVGEDAEDVASEVWLQVARDVARFSGGADGFRGWVAAIGRNRALDHLRWVRRRPVGAVSIEELEMAASVDTAESAVEALGTDAAVELIASLPRDQAEAVLLRVVMGLDAKAAGQVLGKGAGAVRTAAYRGLRTLARRLTPPETTTGSAAETRTSARTSVDGQRGGVTDLGNTALGEVR